MKYVIRTLVFAFVFLAGTALAVQLPDFTVLAEKAGPAVVNISTVKHVAPSQSMRRMFPGGQGNQQPFDDFFDQFEKFFNQRGMNRPREQRSLGSGFVISPDGFIVTNNHVIEGADSIKVNFQDSRNGDAALDAEVIGADKETDLALLKVKTPKSLPYLNFGDSDGSKVGQWVMAIGNPFGLDHTVTAGIISAKGRSIGAGPYDNFLQTDASINPGNSGGPLINLDGEVVGINTAIIASGQGIGFAIPSNLARQVIDQLKQYKTVKRGWLGVGIQNVDENAAKALGLEEAAGALVSSVNKNDPADRAGLKAGDVITAVDGVVIEDAGDLTRKIGGLLPDARIELTVWRDGRTRKITAVLGQRSAEKVAQGDGTPSTPDKGADVAGMTVRTVSNEEAEALGLGETRGLLVVEVAQDSAAEKGGVTAGDVILSANGRAVESADDLEKVIGSDGKDRGAVMLLITRQGHNIFKTIPLS